MSKLTSKSAIQLVKINQEIHDEVLKEVDFYLQYKQPSGHDVVNGGIQYLSKKSIFLQIPSIDESLGGFIIDYGSIKCCYINTYQPRVNQNFIMFHEIYHIAKGIKPNYAHFISVEIEQEPTIDDRKADYFASLILMPEQKMKSFFQELSDDSGFHVKIFKAMNQFKAPYKAILIRMLELNIIQETEKFTEYFNRRFDLEAEFSENGLDASSVQRSMVKNIPEFDKVFNKYISNQLIPESTNEKNRELYNLLVDKLTKARRD